jgi:hypothetical protein
MKAMVKAKQARARKRDLFAELSEGMTAGKANLSHPYIGSDTCPGEVSRQVKRLLRERFRDKRKRG